MGVQEGRHLRARPVDLAAFAHIGAAILEGTECIPPILPVQPFDRHVQLTRHLLRGHELTWPVLVVAGSVIRIGSLHQPEWQRAVTVTVVFVIIRAAHQVA